MKNTILSSFLLFVFTISAQAQQPYYPNYPIGPKVKVMCRDIHPLTWNCIYDSVSANLDSTRFATIDTVIVIVQDSIADIYPIPHDSLDTDTLWVIPGDGLGGGSAVEIGDTITHVVNVDSVTIDILNDTLRADTTTLSTIRYADSLHWASVSKDHYPSYSNFIPWDLNDFQTDQDSVFICFWQEASSYKPYLEVKADSNSTDSQYVHLVYSFTAPRDVSDITDTLLIVEFKTSVADTDSVGCRLMLYEGTTARYTADSVTASTSWTTKAILKTHGTLTSVVTGDRFQLILRVKARTSAGATDPTTWISRIRERWY